MIRFLFFVLLFIPLTACGEQSVSGQTERVQILTARGEGYIFNVELALTVPDQAKGLMHRTDLAEEAGMLFFFGDEIERGFWMKDTLIPLDIIFIKKDGRIHHIHENAKPHDTTSIRSNGPVAAVLEINAGLGRKLGIRAGDRVKHRFFEAK